MDSIEMRYINRQARGCVKRSRKKAQGVVVWSKAHNINEKRGKSCMCKKVIKSGETGIKGS